ncbi:MAG: late competence development ComFB family protein [Candidatus Omnitrophota bacterium]
MQIHNYMEDVVEDALNKILAKREDICACDRCRMDIMSRALNRLPVKYTVTQEGMVFTKLEAIKLQFLTDVTREVTLAVEYIRNNLRH